MKFTGDNVFIQGANYKPQTKLGDTVQLCALEICQRLRESENRSGLSDKDQNLNNNNMQQVFFSLVHPSHTGSSGARCQAFVTLLQCVEAEELERWERHLPTGLFQASLLSPMFQS